MQNIDYQFRQSKKARNLRISVHRDLRVVVTIPRGFKQTKVEKFIQAKIPWVQKSLEYFKKHQSTTIIKPERGGYRKHKTKALDLIKKKIEHWNSFYNFKYGKVSIKNQKTRWGSCSRKGNLNFNFKVIYLPEGLLDYLVVHELCHLREFNHSKKFWDLVRQTMPEFKKVRRELKSGYF